jgi:hypothetical protein
MAEIVTRVVTAARLAPGYVESEGMAAASPLNREAGVIGGAKSEGFSRLQLAPAGAEHRETRSGR